MRRKALGFSFDENTDGTPDECPPAPMCPADWNHDLLVNSQDFLDFLSGFLMGEGDFNGDGKTMSDDYFAFLKALFKGC